MPPSASASTSSATLAHQSTENTPLLGKQKATTFHEDAACEIDHSEASDVGDEELEGDKGREVEVYKPGKSSFSQTLLNVLGDIIGTGLLACPIAFAHAGWVLGPLLMALTGAVTLFTLKRLLRIIEQDRRLRNFTDVIGFGLGATGEKWVTALFMLEICAWLVALVVLFSDSMEAVFPQWSSNQWKIIGLIVIIPTGFLPLRYLSFSSALGITATWTLVGILIFSGITTTHSPGALRDPAPTDLFPSHGLVKLGTVAGLLISGFGGHGLIPNLIHDMKNPKQADRVCEVAYGIAMTVYLLVAICGYIMYGTNVSDEISKDLAKTPGFSPIINKIAVLMVAINPLTKVPLGLRPIADMIFSWFSLHPTVLIPYTSSTPRYATRPSSPTSDSPPPSPIPPVDAIEIQAEISHYRHERLKSFLRPVIRVVLAVLSVVGALVMPSFESVLSLLGSGLGVLSIIIIPIWAGASVFGWKKYEMVICVLSLAVGVIGTVCAFWPQGNQS